VGRDLLEDLPSDRAVSGTPLYMAPEVLSGGKATFRSDVYSLGVLLFHLVTGSYPVEAGSLTELARKHESGDPKLLRELRPDLPEPFLHVVERALATDPAQRFASAGRMEQALAAVLGTETPDSRWQLTEGTKRWLRIAATLVLVAGVVGISVNVLNRWTEKESIAEPSATLEPPAAPAADSDLRQRIARLHDQAGFYEALGSYDRAQATLAEALSGAERALGADDPLVAESLGRLAWIQRLEGDVGGARALYERAARIVRSHPGGPSPDAASVLLGLASLLRESGQLEGAAEYLEEALGIRERALGADDPRVAEVLDELAKLHVDRGDPEAARAALERARVIQASRANAAGPPATASLEGLGASSMPSRTFTVQAALYRRDPAGDRRLATGDRVAPDDRLFLEFRASAPLHVYVINEDDRGEANLLFPLPGFDLANPLPADTAHHLPARRPRDGARVFWQVSSAGGREHFLVVASPEPLLEFEEELRRLPLPVGDDPLIAAELSETTTSRLRGIGQLRGIGKLAVESAEPAVPVAGGSGRLFDLAREFAGRAETVRGVWIRQIDLENPMR